MIYFLSCFKCSIKWLIFKNLNENKFIRHGIKVDDQKFTQQTWERILYATVVNDAALSLFYKFWYSSLWEHKYVRS